MTKYKKRNFNLNVWVAGSRVCFVFVLLEGWMEVARVRTLGNRLTHLFLVSSFLAPPSGLASRSLSVASSLGLVLMVYFPLCHCSSPASAQHNLPKLVCIIQWAFPALCSTLPVLEIVTLNAWNAWWCRQTGLGLKRETRWDLATTSTEPRGAVWPEWGKRSILGWWGKIFQDAGGCGGTLINILGGITP